LAAQYLAALLDDTQRLAEYKVPETLEIVHEILRNTFGKIDRSNVIDNGFGM
jgi:acyl-CoA synthetase (AMP-forming)/AMP-acid ligase II